MELKSCSENEERTGIALNAEDELLVQSESRLANLSVEEEKMTVAEEILIKREQGMEMRKKSRLVKLRSRSRMSKKKRDKKTRERLLKKISVEIADQISNQWKDLETRND